MEDMTSKLAAKGWSRTEIRKTADILSHAQEYKSVSMKFLEQSAFWVALLIAIFGNFVVSVVLVPFLLLLKGAALYATVFAVGVSFGLIFNVLIHYIEELGEGKHIIAGAFIPALALINIYIIAYFSNRLEILMQLATPAHSPLGVSITYVIAFILPYVMKHIRHMRKK